MMSPALGVPEEACARGPARSALRDALAAGVCCMLLGACGAGAPRGAAASTEPRADATPALRPLVVTIEESADPEREVGHAQEVRLTAADVAARRERDHGALPEMARESESRPDAWPTVTVRNDTQHGLIVWFSGPCPRTLALLPQAEHTAELCEGPYDIAAQLTADDFLPFVGEGDELENGYGYSLSFYVIAEPHTETRVRRHR